MKLIKLVISGNYICGEYYIETNRRKKSVISYIVYKNNSKISEVKTLNEVKYIIGLKK